MKYTKSFIPDQDSSFLNDSTYGSFSSNNPLFEPTSLKLSKPIKPNNQEKFNKSYPLSKTKVPEIQYPNSTLNLPSNPINFPRSELKLAQKPLIVSISEKTGYNFISILKEFTDQARTELNFDFITQINSFQCFCLMNNLIKGEGKGPNKQEAKKEAAKQTILMLIKENRQYSDYFSRFINIEKTINTNNTNTNTNTNTNNPPSIEKFEKEDLSNEDISNNGDINNNGDNEDNEIMAYLNQYCQQRFQINPSFKYEPFDKGFEVIIRCGKLEQKAEGPSKKLARRKAAKMLCEKIGLKIASQSIIDEIALKCQKLLKKTPLYTQLENSKDNIFQIRISCGNYIEIGIGILRKEAKLQAAEKLMKRLDSLQKTQDFLEDSDDEISEFPNIDDKENSVEISLSKPKPGLFDIKNCKLNKHQDFFLIFAEDKLKNLNDNKINVLAQETELLRKYDKLHLKPEKEELNKLESMFSDILAILNPQSLSILKIENLTPLGSFINYSLRNYKFEIDLLAVFDPSFKNPKQIIENIKEFLMNERIAEKYVILTSQDKEKRPFLQINIEDEFKKHDLFHQIKIIPYNKYHRKLTIMLRCNMIMLKTLENMDLSKEKEEDLKILRRILKCLKDNRFEELKGEIVDILIFLITRKFTQIEIIRNVKEFFEFIALGGFSCNKENQWFLGGLPDECFNEYVKAELSNEIIMKMEKMAKKILEKGMEELLKNFK